MRFLSRNLGVVLVTVALPLFFSCEKHNVGELPHYHDPGHGHGDAHGQGGHAGGGHGTTDHGAPHPTGGEAHNQTHDPREGSKPTATPAKFFPDKQP